MNNPPKYILELLSRLSRAGYESYLAGGCVRDLLRGKRPSDYDVATPAKPEEVRALFKRVIDTGIRHGTVTVLRKDRPVEVTTFRSEGEYLDHRRPKEVKFETDVRLDLSRRDFTVNAMALDKDGAILDPFGGKKDLEAGILRAVGDASERFREDALRMLRAFRFSAVLGFEIEEKTLKAIRECAPLVKFLSAERVREEFCKTLLSDRPETIGQAAALGLFEPYLSRGTSAPKGLSRLPKNLAARLAAFVSSQTTDARTFASVFLAGLKFDTQTKKLTLDILSVLSSPPPDDPGIKAAIHKYGADAVLAAEVIGGKRKPTAVKRILASDECTGYASLAVNGKDLLSLGYAEGKELGRLLEALLFHVFEHPTDNERHTLLALADQLVRQSVIEQTETQETAK